MIEVTSPPLNQICCLGRGAKYIEINNSVGQKWYIPVKHSKIHLSMFQPSSLKGKIVARQFGIIKYFPNILKLIHARQVAIEFLPQFMLFINELLNVEGCELSIFCGSPGHHQKPTILIGKDDQILGYCKITDSESIKDLFVQEHENLNYLHEKGITDVPASLYCGELKFCNNIYAFVQTTKRKRHIKLATTTSRELFKFLDNFNNRTLQQIEFGESDFAKVLVRLKKNLKLLKESTMRNTYETAISLITESCKGTMAFTASHGDLTSWNSFIVDGKLFAFDLEYFRNSLLPWNDYFHFFTQEMIYNKYANAQAIYGKYLELKHSVLKNVPQIEITYISYLLVISDFYLNRDQGILNERIGDCFKIWSALIEKLIHDVKGLNQ